AISVAGIGGALQGEIGRRSRPLFQSRAGASMEGRAFLLVDDPVAPHISGQSVRSKDAGRRAELPVQVPRRSHRLCGKLRRLAVLLMNVSGRPAPKNRRMSKGASSRRAYRAAALLGTRSLSSGRPDGRFQPESLALPTLGLLRVLKTSRWDS